MKLVLEFIVDKNVFPLEYRRTFMHFFKSCLDNANGGKYFDTYYKDTKMKNFTFAVFFDNPLFNNNLIELSSNRVKMLFSTSEELTGFIFYSSFLEKKNKKINLTDDNYMTLKNIVKISEPVIKNNKILIKMNSPLVIRSHLKEENKDYYYSVGHESFETEVLKTIKYQLEKQGFNSTYLVGLKFKPIKTKKVIVKHYKCKVEASIGNFLIEGNPSILTYLLQCGVGSRKSEGFGMMELLSQNI